MDEVVTGDVVLKACKVDDANKYIQLNLTDVAWGEVTATGSFSEGDTIAQNKSDYFTFQLTGQPRTVDVEFVDVASNFSTHYPA